MICDKEARYLSDKATLEGGGAKWANQFKQPDGSYTIKLQSDRLFNGVNIL